MLLGKLFNKKTLVKDSTMNGIVKLRYMPFGKYMQRMVIENCYFIAMTGVIEENFLKLGAPQNRIFKIPNGVTVPSVFNNKAKNEYKCIFVGNLYQQPAKGVDVLLEAWINVIKEFPLASLNIIGDGDLNYYNAISKSLGIAESVMFLGKQKSAMEFYLDANLFVLPSRREGMSNALLEAMAVGLPCIATNISGNQDLIDNMKDGILIPAEDVISLSNAIIWSFNNYEELKTFGLKARTKIFNDYNIDLIISKYVTLYQSLLLVEDN